MTDDDDAAEGEVPFPRAYDYFKHMTGIALVSIGGVFAFLDGSRAGSDRTQYIMVLGFLGLSGVTSLMMAGMLAGIETKPIPRAKLVRQVRLGQSAALFLLAVGLGIFIPTFANGVLK